MRKLVLAGCLLLGSCGLPWYSAPAPDECSDYRVMTLYESPMKNAWANIKTVTVCVVKETKIGAYNK